MTVFNSCIIAHLFVNKKQKLIFLSLFNIGKTRKHVSKVNLC